MKLSTRKSAVFFGLCGIAAIVLVFFMHASWLPFLGGIALACFGGSFLMLRDDSAPNYKMMTYVGMSGLVIGSLLAILFAQSAVVTEQQAQLTLFLHTLLNGFQAGVFLFLVAAGLTLVLGIMNMVNLAHGSLFLMGAYFAGWFFVDFMENFYVALLVSLPLIVIVGILLERVVIQWLYERDHLYQVLATFGLLLFFKQAVIEIFGTDGLPLDRPEALNGGVVLFGAQYPLYQLVVCGVGLVLALAMYLLVSRTRIGMLIRAGASNRSMAGALGVDIGMLFVFVFALGALLAGFAGAFAGPLEAVEPDMGEPKLILAIVVIVIGGIGSIRGAFIAALVVGMVEASGKTFMTDIVRDISSFVLSWEASVIDEFAQTAGPALSSMIIYILMAAILFFKPQGLFPAKSG